MVRYGGLGRDSHAGAHDSLRGQAALRAQGVRRVGVLEVARVAPIVSAMQSPVLLSFASVLRPTTSVPRCQLARLPPRSRPAPGPALGSCRPSRGSQVTAGHRALVRRAQRLGLGCVVPSGEGDVQHVGARWRDCGVMRADLGWADLWRAAGGVRRGQRGSHTGKPAQRPGASNEDLYIAGFGLRPVVTSDVGVGGRSYGDAAQGNRQPRHPRSLDQKQAATGASMLSALAVCVMRAPSWPSGSRAAHWW